MYESYVWEGQYNNNRPQQQEKISFKAALIHMLILKIDHMMASNSEKGHLSPDSAVLHIFSIFKQFVLALETMYKAPICFKHPTHRPLEIIVTKYEHVAAAELLEDKHRLNRFWKQ